MTCLRLFATTLTLSAALAACGDDTVAPLGGTDQGGAPGTGGGEGGESCEDKGGQCLDLPPGFEGPVQVNDSGVATCTSEAFVGAFEEEAIIALDAECGCVCQVENATCPLTGVAYADAACGSINTATFTLLDTCIDLPDVGATSPLSIEILNQAAPSADCTNDLAAAVVSPISFEPEVVGCNVNLDSCADGVVCVPQVGQYCVYSTTETACPAGFDEIHTLYREEDIDDTRDCECSCGDATIACTPMVSLFSATDCTGDLTEQNTADCYSASGAPGLLGSALVDDGMAASCETTTAVTGAIDITGPGLLVCCAP